MSSTTAKHDARARVIQENYKKICEYYLLGGQTYLGGLLRSMATVMHANFDEKNTAEAALENFQNDMANLSFGDVPDSDEKMLALLSFGKLFGAAFEDMIDRTSQGRMVSRGRKRRRRSPSTSSDIATTSSHSMRTRPTSGAKAHRNTAIPARRRPTTGGNYLKIPPPGHPIYSLPVTDFTFPRLITDPLLERRSRNGTPPIYEDSVMYDPMLAQPFLKRGRPMFDALLDDSDDSSPPPPKPKARVEKKTVAKTPKKVMIMKTPKKEVVSPGVKRATPKMMAIKSVKKEEDSVDEETVHEWAVDCFDKKATCFICFKVCHTYESVSNHLYHQHKGACQKNYIFGCDGCKKHWSSFRGAMGHIRTAIRMNGIGCKNKMTYLWEGHKKNEEDEEQIVDIEEGMEEGEGMEEEGEGIEADENEDNQLVIKEEAVDEEEEKNGGEDEEEVEEEEQEENEQRAPAMLVVKTEAVEEEKEKEDGGGMEQGEGMEDEGEGMEADENEDDQLVIKAETVEEDDEKEEEEDDEEQVEDEEEEEDDQRAPAMLVVKTEAVDEEKEKEEGGEEEDEEDDQRAPAM